jgi:hypothetical protein
MMNSKTFTVILFVLALGCKKASPIAVEQKPDLTFGQITYARHLAYNVPFAFTFTIIVRNIGTSELSQSFYISNSRSKAEFNDQSCSHTQLVNDPPTRIAVGDSIQVSIVDAVDDSVPQILFVINTNDRYDRGVPLPMIDELSYDNNSVTLAMKW